MANLLEALNWHWSNLLIIPGVLIAYTVYELAYALTAYQLGDNSQVGRGNISLNPFQHLSWLGAFTFLLTGFIGFPKPLRFDSRFFKDKHLDSLLVSLAGPVANLSLSLLGFLGAMLVALALDVNSSTTGWSQVWSFFLLDRANPPPTFNFQSGVQALTGQVWLANFTLAAVSLIPLPSSAGFVALKSIFSHLREQRGSNEAGGEKSRPASAWPVVPQSMRRANAAAIHFEKGVLYHQEGKFDDAVARYRQALGSDQNYGPAYINLGRAHLGKGQRKEAIRAFRGATQLASDEKSRTQAWAHLHELTEISVVDPQIEQKALNKQGATPWTNTRPSPDWLALGAGALFIVIVFACIYGYIFVNLAGHL